MAECRVLHGAVTVESRADITPPPFLTLKPIVPGVDMRGERKPLVRNVLDLRDSLAAGRSVIPETGQYCDHHNKIAYR